MRANPSAFIEAYASGCAVITTDHSGIFDIFSDGLNGFAVEKQSSIALKIAIEKAMGMPETIHAMAATNFTTALQRYRASKHTRELIAIVANVAEQAPQS